MANTVSFGKGFAPLAGPGITPPPAPSASPLSTPLVQSGAQLAKGTTQANGNTLYIGKDQKNLGEGLKVIQQSSERPTESLFSRQQQTLYAGSSGAPSPSLSRVSPSVPLPPQAVVSRPINYINQARLAYHGQGIDPNDASILKNLIEVDPDPAHKRFYLESVNSGAAPTQILDEVIRRGGYDPIVVNDRVKNLGEGEVGQEKENYYDWLESKGFQDARALGLGIGALKSVVKMVANVADLSARALSGTANALVGSDPLNAAGETAAVKQADAYKNIVEPVNGYEKIGGILGDAAVAYGTAGIPTAGRALLDAGISKAGMTATQAALSRIGGVGVIEGAFSSALGLVQSGDLGEAKKSGILGALIGSTLQGVSEGANALGFKKSLGNVIYKENKADAARALQGDSLEAIKVDQPQLYKQLKDGGFISAKAEKYIMKAPLAERADALGLTGDLNDQAYQSFVGKYTKQIAIDEALSKADAAKKAVVVSNRYKDALDELAQTYERIGDGSVGQKASELSASLKPVFPGTGDLTPYATTPSNAYEVRKFLDKFIQPSTYNSTSIFPAEKQLGFKQLADNLRIQITDAVPSTRKLLEDEQTYIEAFDHIAETAKRQNNRQAIDSVDILIGLSALSGNPENLAVGLARQTYKNPTLAGKTAALLGNSKSSWLGKLLTRLGGNVVPNAINNNLADEQPVSAFPE